MEFCPSCGAELYTSEELYCHDCGCPVGEDEDINEMDFSDEMRDDALELKFGKSFVKRWNNS